MTMRDELGCNGDGDLCRGFVTKWNPHRHVQLRHVVCAQTIFGKFASDKRCLLFASKAAHK